MQQTKHILDALFFNAPVTCDQEYTQMQQTRHILDALFFNAHVTCTQECTRCFQKSNICKLSQGMQKTGFQFHIF